ncbi:MAG: hypothetical protein R2765_05040 [Ferruginibacter sp.]
MKKIFGGGNGCKKYSFPGSSSYGVKPVSSEGSKRLVRAAIEHALKQPALGNIGA